MKKIIAFVALTVAAACVSGCIQQITPSTNSVKLNEIDFAQSSTWREGESCMFRFLFFPPAGIASVKNAAEQAKISKVNLVDYNYQNYLIYERFCVKAYGK